MALNLVQGHVDRVKDVGRVISGVDLIRVWSVKKNSEFFVHWWAKRIYIYEEKKSKRANRMAFFPILSRNAVGGR